jgi:hypothetical protein
MERGRPVFGGISWGGLFEPDNCRPLFLFLIPDVVPATRPIGGKGLFRTPPDGVLDTMPSVQGVVSRSFGSTIPKGLFRTLPDGVLDTMPSVQGVVSRSFGSTIPTGVGCAESARFAGSVKVIPSAIWPFARSRRLRKRRRVMMIRVMKTITPTVAPTITPTGDEGEELLEEAAGGGVVILNPISFTRKKRPALKGYVGLGTVASTVDIVRFIWGEMYPIVGSEPRTTDV